MGGKIVSYSDIARGRDIHYEARGSGVAPVAELRIGIAHEGIRDEHGIQPVAEPSYAALKLQGAPAVFTAHI